MDELRVTWEAEFSGKLLALLRRETRLYTSGESGSIPWETAQGMLASLLYTLRLDGEDPGERGRQLAEADLEEELRRGRQRLRRKMADARRLWRRLAESGAAGDSRALGETLLGIGEFWRRYDWRFAAHEVPCDIDYPLALPVSEELRGVDYLTEWLGRLDAEVRFRDAFPREAREAAWERFHPERYDLPLNLYEPLAADALCLFALGQDVRALAVGPEERRAFAARMDLLTEGETEASLRRWAEGLGEALGLPEGRDQRYLTAYAGALLPRVRTAVARGRLAGNFPVKGCENAAEGHSLRRAAFVRYFFRWGSRFRQVWRRSGRRRTRSPARASSHRRTAQAVRCRS